MMTALMALLFSLFSFQSEEFPAHLKQDETYFIHGKILLDSRYYGGMYREYTDENAVPAHGVQLKVVRFEKGKESKVVDTVKTDVNGRFSVELTPGTYGFIGMDEEPEEGQYLPKGYFKDDKETSSSSNWSANLGMPLKLADKDIVGFHITNLRTSACKRCP